MTDKTMGFPQAIEQVMTGKKITRKEWGNEAIHGTLRDGVLKIFLLDDNKYHDWIISDGDLMAIDWVVVESN